MYFQRLLSIFHQVKLFKLNLYAKFKQLIKPLAEALRTVQYNRHVNYSIPGEELRLLLFNSSLISLYSFKPLSRGVNRSFVYLK